MPTSDELRLLQALPLELKVARTKQRIREWVDYWGKDHVCVSFSGGKDSTVLLHIVREMYGDEIPAVFVNTGLEYPEIQRHVRSFPNVVILRPEMNFRDVITKYGYPVISKEVSQVVAETRRWYSKFVIVERERQTQNETFRGTLQSCSELVNSQSEERKKIPRWVKKLLGVGEFAKRREKENPAVGEKAVRVGRSRDEDGGDYP